MSYVNFTKVSLLDAAKLSSQLLEIVNDFEYNKDVRVLAAQLARKLGVGTPIESVKHEADKAGIKLMSRRKSMSTSFINFRRLAVVTKDMILGLLDDIATDTARYLGKQRQNAQTALDKLKADQISITQAQQILSDIQNNHFIDWSAIKPEVSFKSKVPAVPTKEIM